MKAKDLFPGIFSRHAEAYRRRIEASLDEGQAASRERLLDRLAPKPGERLLDLACGPGTLTLRLAEAVGPQGDVLGVDLAPGMIEVARREAAGRSVKVRFEVMDLEALALPDGGFDGAACGHGLQFCPDLGAALREARRVLRPGGRLVASVPVDREQSRASLIMRELESKLPPQPEATDREQTVNTVRDLEHFRRAALEAGFGRAEAERLDERRTWPNARALVDNVSGWWTTAARLEQLDEAGREQFRQATLAALEKEFGNGPIPILGAAHLLYAVA